MPIGARLDPEHLEAPAGADVHSVLVLDNPGASPVHVRLVLGGEVAGWGSVEPGDLWVAPGAEEACEVRFRLPRGAPGGIGAVPYTVRVLSDQDGEGGATARGTLDVVGEAELAIRLLPGMFQGTLSATTKIAVDNLGDLPARAQLHVDAPASVVVDVEPDSLIVEPGSTAFARLHARPVQRRTGGGSRRHDLWVRLEPMGGARISVQGTMVQRSLVAGLLPKVVLGLVALVAVAVVLVRALENGAGEAVTAGPITTVAPSTTTTEGPTTTAAAVAEPGAPPPTVPLAERRLAFQTRRDGNFEVYTAAPDGRDPRNLSLHPGHDGEPAWSPDHMRLAFDSDRGGNFDIYVMNADGANVVQLTTEPAPDGYPTWSPDGSRIAFHSDRDGNYEIYVMNPDGTDQRNLTNVAGNDKNPAWSPNGARLAFDSTRDGSLAELYVMGGDGSLPVRLTTNDDVDAWPAWTPDGARLVFQTNRDSDLELHVMSAGGGESRRLTESPGDDAEPDWG